MHTAYLSTGGDVKQALLALLAAGATHGYQLKRTFEDRFSAVWPPVNIGQIYSTLQRLERDGLVRSREVGQSGRPAKRVYELTAEGDAELRAWIGEPSAGSRIRDDFVMKLILAPPAGLADPIELIDRQRTAYLLSMRDMNQAADEARGDADAELIVTRAVLHLEADLRWLDLCESRFSEGERDDGTS